MERWLAAAEAKVVESKAMPAEVVVSAAAREMATGPLVVVCRRVSLTYSRKQRTPNSRQHSSPYTSQWSQPVKWPTTAFDRS